MEIYKNYRLRNNIIRVRINDCIKWIEFKEGRKVLLRYVKWVMKEYGICLVRFEGRSFMRWN